MNLRDLAIERLADVFVDAGHEPGDEALAAAERFFAENNLVVVSMSLVEEVEKAAGEPHNDAERRCELGELSWQTAALIDARSDLVNDVIDQVRGRA